MYIKTFNSIEEFLLSHGEDKIDESFGDHKIIHFDILLFAQRMENLIRNSHVEYRRKENGSVFGRVLEKVAEPLFVTEKQLREPVTLKENGDIATLYDLMYESQNLKRVRDLDEEEMMTLALEILRQSNPEERYASLGSKEFTKDQMMEEVKNSTPHGARIINSIRYNALFMEQAIREDKIKLKDSSGFELPDFEF